jgi:hypothetical protein
MTNMTTSKSKTIIGKMKFITNFKTNRINAYTGGKIADYELDDYPKTKDDDGVLHNSFIAPDGTYLGDYKTGWWYYRKNMVVCHEYPLGVAIILKTPYKEYKLKEIYESTGKIHPQAIKGICGFSHRGGTTFVIGDRLFNAKYKPTEKDYDQEQWAKFVSDRDKSIKESLERGWFANEKEALLDTPISDVIPFRLRGNKVITTWEEALQSAKNLSSYLS